MTKKTVFLTVLLVSVVTLELQLLQTRILSVVLWYHFVYIVITMALLGFAASGTVLFLSDKLKYLKDEDFFALSLIFLSITVFITSKYGYFPIRDTFLLNAGPRIIFGLIATYTLFMLPYFFAGLIIGWSFIRFADLTGKIYFVNLLGSGIGCIVFLILIGNVGASHLISLTALLCLVPLFINMEQIHSYRRGIFIWYAFLILSIAFPENSSFHHVYPERHKQFWAFFGKDTKVEYTRWNPISRIDVISNKKAPWEKFILMDGDFAACLFPTAMVRERISTVQADRKAAYVLMDTAPRRVLIVGAGGGFDVQSALLNNAKIIDAVEINPTTGYLISDIYSSHIDDIFHYPNIHLFIEDGRSFVKRSHHKYDVIMIYYTDSLLALSTGAYTLCDNFLYTKEAFVDYLDHLNKDGIIQIGRWAYPGKPRETLRIFSLAIEALREKGIKNPASHIFVISASEKKAENVIFKKDPFTQKEKERLLRFCATHNLNIWYPPASYELVKEQDYNYPFIRLAAYFEQNKEQDFFNQYEFDVSPTSDDRPFFYHYNKRLVTKKNEVSDYYDRIRGAWNIFVLKFLLLNSLILTMIFVLLPLVFSRKKMPLPRGGFFVCIYFASIGFAFMFLEMGIVQKFVLFLGSPIYSMAIVIPIILFAAGLGSLSSNLIKKNLGLWITVLVTTCAGLIFIFSRLMPYLSNVFLLSPLWVRIGISIISLVPVSYFMGYPFPLALKVVSRNDARWIPWVWAVNGSSSVIASILAIMVAISFGFNVVIMVSGCFYIVAALACSNFLKKNTN